MKITFFILTLFFSFNSISQKGKRKIKVSNEKGTFFASWGYHRAVYSESDLYLSGYHYDFDLANSKAHDQQSKLNSGDYSIKSISVPQYNFKVGYYFKQKWNITLALDHMKYIFSDFNRVALTGFVTVPVGEVSLGDDRIFSNSYHHSQTITTNKNQFHYENAKGLNYVHAQLGYTERLYVAGKKNNFTLAYNAGIGTGIIISTASLFFNNIQEPPVQSLSGYGVSRFAGLRGEIYKHFYIYSNLSVGFLHKVNERTSPSFSYSYARQMFGYSQIEIGVGIFLFKRVKNKCDDCPVW